MANADRGGLTRRQALFVSEYLIDRNGTQAAIRAGYAAKGAAAEASRMLKQPKIAAAMRAADLSAVAAASVATARVIDKFQVTREGQFQKLEDIRQGAMVAENFGAAAAAVAAQNKMMGLDAPTKVELDAKVEDVTPASQAEKARTIAAALAQAANEANAGRVH